MHFKENNHIPASLYPSLPPLYTENEKFHRRWRYISHSAAYRHLKLLITECRHKIKALTEGLSHHMELLRNSCLQDVFLFYTTKLDSMASSLESLCLLTDLPRTARFRGVIDHNSTDNNLNQQVNNPNASVNDIPSNVTRKRSCRKTKPVNIQLDHSSVPSLGESEREIEKIHHSC